MTNIANPYRWYRVTSGPYKGHIGRLVEASEVRGRNGWSYLEGESDGMVYEVRPNHLQALPFKRDKGE